MKNSNKWKPTKYIFRHRTWLPNPEYISKPSLYVASKQIEHYKKFIEKYSSGKLLDCGAGTVPYYGIYKHLVTEITCIDWGESHHQSIHIDKEVDLTQPLPFSNDCFDTVLLADVLEHIPNPKDLFSEIARVLSKGGNAIIFVPFMYWLHEDPHDYHRYTEYALKTYSEEAGLSVTALEPYGGGADVLIDIGYKLFLKNIFFFLANKYWWRFMKIIGVYNLLTTKWHKKKFPLGYSLVVTKI